MTVTEYRKKHPNCSYCFYAFRCIEKICPATAKIFSKKTAKRCPCYRPMEWPYDDLENEKTEGV